MKQNLLKAELSSIFKNRMKLISIIAIIFIPILYAGLYLWAFWDPYGNLEKLPVAVVNEDSGTEMNDKKLEIGNDLVENLKDSNEFDFTFVDKEKAYKGLNNQKYYMIIEIPENFSENATTLLEDNPKKLDLKYVSNPGYNFISSQIGNSAIEKIKAGVSKEVTKTYAESIFENLNEMKDGLQSASSGAEKLKDGTSKVKDGSTEIYKNLETLAEKSLEFSNGVNSANSGVNELADGANSLNSGLQQLQTAQGSLNEAAGKLQGGDQSILNGTTQLKDGIASLKSNVPSLIDGTNTLQSGSDTLASGLTEWSGKSAELATGAKQLNEGVVNLQQTIESMMPLLAGLPDENKEQLVNALQQLVDGSDSIASNTTALSQAANQLAEGGQNLSSGLTELNKGQEKLQTGVDQLNEGSVKLEDGVKQQVAGQEAFLEGMNKYTNEFAKAAKGSEELANGAQTLLTGMNTLSSGSVALSDGTSKLKNGSKDLVEGTDSLLDGSKELSDKLADGADEADAIHSDEKTYDMIAEPIKVEDSKVSDVPNYGTALAPYFISLGLFVGALMLSIVFAFDEPEGKPRSGIRWFLSKTAILMGVGLLQALVASLVLLVFLGIEVQSVPLFILFTILTSIVFFSIIQFFVTLLGNPGRFIAVLIMIFQLITSAGTFPLELIPDVLQFIHKLLPMSYSVAGLRAVISTGDFTYMWHNASILIIYPIIFLIGTAIFFVVKFKRNFATTAEANVE
ncbi:MAG TPA: YhgE/Pip domain-containing protein [Niallia sp.]|nr:YhgE/Pip domain-containing protein [Niallia sp.]